MKGIEGELPGKRASLAPSVRQKLGQRFPVSANASFPLIHE